jgi:hypothetical protein
MQDPQFYLLIDLLPFLRILPVGGIRPALVQLVVFGVLLCPTLGSHVSRASTTRIDGPTARPYTPSMVRVMSSEPTRPRNIAQFSQWRYRMKSVLVETTDPTADESDLGPAVIPRRLSSVSPLDLSSRRFATIHPLRC